MEMNNFGPKLLDIAQSIARIELGLTTRSVKTSARGRVCHLGSDDRVVLMCAELDEQSAQRCKT